LSNPLAKEKLNQMTNLYSENRSFRNDATAIDRLSDHIRLRSLSWCARRLVRDHGLHAATAKTIAELIYTEDR
jgi:hypothetical protein